MRSRTHFRSCSLTVYWRCLCHWSFVFHVIHTGGICHKMWHVCHTEGFVSPHAERHPSHWRLRERQEGKYAKTHHCLHRAAISSSASCDAEPCVLELSDLHSGVLFDIRRFWRFLTSRNFFFLFLTETEQNKWHYTSKN